MGLARFARLRGSQVVSTWLRGGGTGIARIQRDTITITNGTTSNTATLPVAVDTTRSRVVLLGVTAAGDATVDPVACRVALTNGTTVTATVNSVSGSGNRVVAFEVVEYHPGVIRGIRRGTITTTGADSGTDTISTVTTDRSTVDYLGFTTDSVQTGPGAALVRVVLTNATTVTATGVGAVNRTIGYQVVDWL